MLQPIIGEHIDLRTRLQPDVGKVKADSAQMTRVIMNLVLNSRDAMPGGGKIDIETANLTVLRRSPGVHDLPPGEYVILRLSDTGEGMSPEVMEHVFQPFFTTKAKGQGTGLGLSTVYGIVQQSNGHVSVDSKPGVGTTFTISLPRVDDSGEPAEQTAPPKVVGGSETILLVEDEDGVRRLVKHILDSRGYRVLDAASGPDALVIFEQHRGEIDLLLTDIVMPRMNGRELAQQILQAEPDMKIVYMSGYTDDMLIQTGALRPGTSFLQKPLKPDALAGRIREVLDAR
jgi:CheY-like chemotaxis protein